MQGSDFVDPKVENTFLSAASRATADSYIRERIKVYEKKIKAHREKIIAHEAITCYYKRHLNALTIACRIPPETLDNIFGYVIHDREELSSSRKHDDWGELEWIRSISHVCSHWRHVALSTQRLWSAITFQSPPWAMELVRRSKTVPLTVVYKGQVSPNYSDLPERRFMVLADVLRSHLCRIWSFTLHSQKDVMFTIADTQHPRILELLALLKSAPMMERLELDLPTRGARVRFEMVVQHSQLRHLSMSGCGMAWKLSAPINLRTLSISYIPEDKRPSVEQLLDFLSRTPLLESLTLGTASIVPDFHTSKYTKVIQLGHLKCIAISGFISDSMFLLDHLPLSKNTGEISLGLTVPSFGTRVMKDLAQKVSYGEGSIVEMKLTTGIQCWKSTDSQVPVPKSPPAIDVSFSVATGYMEFFNCAFLQSLDLSRLSSLDIDVQETMPSANMWSLFADLPILENLLLSSLLNSFRLFEALQRGLVVMPMITTPAAPSFPSLKNLTIKHSALGRANGLTKESIIKKMATCFRLRMEAGLHLKLLILQECDEVDGEELHHLRKVIKRVDWDGSGNVNEDESESEETA